MKRSRRVILPLLAVVSALATSIASAQTTVIIVRHAEKEAQPAADPPLTEAGRARANTLWNAVKDARVSAIITTQFVRTIQTAEPTVHETHVVPEVIQAAGADHAARVAAAVKAHAGQTVLVVGHSNTVPAIIAALGAPQPPPICDSEYDNFYVVTLSPSAPPSLVHSRYGWPSVVDVHCMR